MAIMKCRYRSKVYKITCRITKHILAYKVQKEKARRIIPRNILYNTNNFLAKLEAEAIL